MDQKTALDKINTALAYLRATEGKGLVMQYADTYPQVLHDAQEAMNFLYPDATEQEITAAKNWYLTRSMMFSTNNADGMARMLVAFHRFMRMENNSKDLVEQARQWYNSVRRGPDSELYSRGSWIEILAAYHRFILSNAPKTLGWIPVSELPEQHIRVLVKDELGFVSIAYYGKKGYGNDTDGEKLLWRDDHTDQPKCNMDGDCLYPPVAWQPLPEA